MKHDNVENQRSMRGLDLVLRAEVDWDAILPVLQLLVELADGLQELGAVGFGGEVAGVGVSDGVRGK